jgi:hypothetical protein
MTAIRVQQTAVASRTDRAGFSAWRRRRPLVGGILLVLSGVEMFFSGQLDLGNIKIQLGFEGFQATVIPALLAILGLLVILSPAQRMFYGIFALILAVYSLVGVNLGGFLVGMLLGAVGGVMTVAWRPRTAAAPAAAEDRVAESVAADDTVGEPQPLAARRGHDVGVVHAEAVDYATLRARADAKKAAAEPRPFRTGRS